METKYLALDAGCNTICVQFSRVDANSFCIGHGRPISLPRPNAIVLLLFTNENGEIDSTRANLATGEGRCEPRHMTRNASHDVT